MGSSVFTDHPQKCNPSSRAKQETAYGPDWLTEVLFS